MESLIIEKGVVVSVKDKKIESVVIPEDVTEIGKNAFDCCCDLQSIVIPETVTKIGESAFSGCSLESIFIPKSIRYIGRLAFYRCSKLKIRYAGTKEQWKEADIRSENCKNVVFNATC